MIPCRSTSITPLCDLPLQAGKELVPRGGGACLCLSGRRQVAGSVRRIVPTLERLRRLRLRRLQEGEELSEVNRVFTIIVAPVAQDPAQNGR